MVNTGVLNRWDHCTCLCFFLQELVHGILSEDISSVEALLREGKNKPNVNTRYKVSTNNASGKIF